jgi:hypothetical protein
MINPFAASIRATSMKAHHAVGDRKGPRRAANRHSVCMCMCVGLQPFSRSESELNQARRTRQLFLGECGRSSQTKAGGVVLCLRARANGRAGSITATPHTNSPSPKNHTPSPLNTLRRLFFHVPTTGTLGKILAVVRFGVEEDNAATERHGKAPGTFI